MFEENPFPSREAMEAVREGRDLTFRQVADWFERHRRKNSVKNPMNATRGRPRGRPRGSGRPPGSRPPLSNRSISESASPPQEGFGPPVFVANGSGRPRGRPPGVSSSMSKKRRKGRGWINDDDENDYGSTTSEEDAAQDQTYEDTPQEPLSVAVPSESGGAVSDLSNVQSDSELSSLPDAAPYDRAVKRDRPQRPITSYTVRQIAGARPLTYFNRLPPPETEAAFLQSRQDRALQATRA